MLIMAMLLIVDRGEPCMGVTYKGIDHMLKLIKDALKEDNDPCVRKFRS